MSGSSHTGRWGPSRATLRFNSQPSSATTCPWHAALETKRGRDVSRPLHHVIFSMATLWMLCYSKSMYCNSMLTLLRFVILISIQIPALILFRILKKLPKIPIASENSNSTSNSVENYRFTKVPIPSLILSLLSRAAQVSSRPASQLEGSQGPKRPQRPPRALA